jgi:hypothetical protein
MEERSQFDYLVGRENELHVDYLMPSTRSGMAHSSNFLQ